MKYLNLDNNQIPYKINKKKNKNTYFYFKREGYIQINLSKYQTEKDVINYMIANQGKFVRKLENNSKIPPINENELQLLGTSYKILITENSKVLLDTISNQVTLPTTDIKHPIIKSFYRNKMFEVIEMLISKYKDNGYVDITNVKYNTRYTTSRHGSCNANKRRINLNLSLIKYDVKFIEYVYLHEIAHLTHQNHGQKFYDLLGKICPDYKQIRKELKEIYR